MARGESGEAAVRGKGPAASLQATLQFPILEALSEAGGRARPRDVYDAVARRVGVDRSAQERRACRDGQEYAVFDNQVRWARQTAVAQGLLAGDRGVWELTGAGQGRLGRAAQGRLLLVWATDAGLMLWGHAEEAASAIEPGTVDLVMLSPPYPVVRRDYGSLGVAEWLEAMSRLVGAWKRLLARRGTLAVNLGDVHVPGSPTLSTYVERFALDAVDAHGFHLAGRMPWHSPSKLPNLEWCAKRGVVLRNTVEHVILLTPDARPDWDATRVPREPYAARSEAARRRDEARAQGGARRRPGGYDIDESAFRSASGGRVASNLIVSGGAGGGGAYGARCRAAGLPVHPARFPEEVPRRVIGLTTRPGGLVHDPMAGSGVTGKVARDMGRRFVMSERMLRYCEGAAFRFDADPGFVSLAPRT